MQDLKVLIIDDSEECCLAIKCLLINKGCFVDDAQNPNDGLIKFLSNQYDVCLLDYHIGAYTGIDLAKQMLKERPNIPIIILTGDDNHEIFKEAMEAGCADVLEKTDITTALIDRSIRYGIERSMHNAEIRQKEALFRAFINSSPMLAFMKDEEGKYVFVNDVCETWTENLSRCKGSRPFP
jgi:two-component system cell cycle sensor histidine kinase/response regulator CckA